MNIINKNRIIGLIIMIMLLLPIWLSSGEFISEPGINPDISTIYTDQDLSCEWKINETTTANVTWYRNNEINTTYSTNCTSGQKCSTEGAGKINKAYTTKSDSWTCEVTYFNGTAYESMNDTISITDSVPSLSRLYLSNNSEVLNNSITNIPEDSTTFFDANSTDADNDIIKFTIDTNTANCDINAVTGIITCNPNLESHVGLKTLRIKSEDNNSGATNGYVNITINVTQTNDAPYFSPALIDKTVIQDNSLDYAITGHDVESNIPYHFSISSPLSSVIIENTSDSTAVIRFNNSGIDAATFADRGNHTITVTINDSAEPSLSYSEDFNLEVIPVNNLPQMSIHVDNSTSLIQGGSLLILVNGSDINNDTLTFYCSEPELYDIEYGATYKGSPSGVSYANASILVLDLNNSHVVRHNITITIFDSKQNYSQSVLLNITNSNDDPIMQEISNYSINTLNNRNISNLTAYTGVSFLYRINATDVDSLTYEGETLSFSSNESSSFPINSSTGIISFTPYIVGNYSFIITVTDRYNATSNRTAMLYVYPNRNPVFTDDNITITCYEYDAENYASNCHYNLSANVTDNDINDAVSSYWTNSTIFEINASTGIINFSVNQSTIGNYSIIFNATDTRGGINSTVLSLILLNTNNRPYINSTELLSSGRMVIGDTYQISVEAYDTDIFLPNSYENLTFSINVTGADPSIFSIIKLSSDQAIISFSPEDSDDAGNYTINITVTDYYGNISVPSITRLFLYNTTLPPNITEITPYGTPLSSSVQASWANASQFIGMLTNITILENTTYIFNQTTVADNISYGNELNYSWSYDGVRQSTDSSYSRYFDFFSSGMHNITFLTVDEFNKSASFTWHLNIIDVNRPPVLWNPLDNLTGDFVVNKSTNYGGYMYRHGDPLTYKFYDPDDDLDSDLTIDEDENNTLTYSATYCANANFVFIGTTLRVETVSIGECLVNFTAIDALNSSMNVTSYTVFINVSAVSNDTVPEPTPIRSSGGGGTNTQTITIPLPEEVEKPKPLQILTPKLITVYKNATIKVPIIMNNTWNDTLEGIRLTAMTNASNVTLYLDKTFFPRIPTGFFEEVTLTIGNYKSEGHYEIQIYANVTNPLYKDLATIFVNSADMKSEGEELESLISFAQDLLSSNPECQELTELLNEAKKELNSDNYAATAKLVDSVINGCKYLVSSSSNKERPGNSFVKMFDWKRNYNQYLILTSFIVIFVIAAYYIIKREPSEKEF